LCTAESSWTESYQFFFNYYAQAVDIHGNIGNSSNVVEYVYPTIISGTGGTPAFRQRANPD
jgi:hypothetical protein